MPDSISGFTGTNSAQRRSHAASRDLALATSNSDPRGDRMATGFFTWERFFLYISNPMQVKNPAVRGQWSRSAF